MSNPPVLVYVVEDDPEHRNLLHDIAEGAGYRPRTFASGEELLKVFDRLSPGVLLLDLKLPGIRGGFLAEHLVRKKGCWWPAIILTGHPEAEEVERARKAGVINVLRKPIKAPPLLAMLEEARKRLVSSRVENPNPGLQARIESLTPDELAVLDGLREGLQEKQIADKCDISERTVRTRIDRILEKTGAHSRPHLLQLVVTAGLPVRPPK